MGLTLFYLLVIHGCLPNVVLWHYTHWTKIGEVAILKMKVQTLETENKTLKSSFILTNITSIDLNKFIDQRPNNKLGLEYEKSSKTSNCLKSKEK
jgi:hypothetical protein